MINKQEAVEYIANLAKDKVLTKKEVVSAYEKGGGSEKLGKKLGITEILYYIGGAIVFLGIALLVSLNWSLLSFETRLLATLGAGIAAYFVGVLFGRETKTESVSLAFFLISALTLPIGLYVFFDNMGADLGSNGMQSLISGILFVTFLLSFLVFKKSIFALFSIIFGTWLFFSFTGIIIGGSPYADAWHLFEYRALIVGLSYMLFGYSFSKNKLSSLSGALYGFGILGFLGAALSLGGWEPHQSIIWEMVFPGLVLGTLFLSIYIERKSFLVWGTIFLVAYILKITGEYFSEGLGWPLTLVLIGFLLMIIGYLFVWFQKKYFSK